MKTVFLQATMLSVSHSLIYYITAAAFGLCAFLVVEGNATFDELIRFVVVNPSFPHREFGHESTIQTYVATSVRVA